MISAVFSLCLLQGNINAESLFPEITGWKMQEEKRIYNNSDLWELINGAADIFLTYGFQDLHIAEYSKSDQIIRVELYRHSTPQNAFGIYSAERMPDYPQVNVGSQGYKSEGVLNFLAGIYYVKVMSAGPAQAEESMIAQVAGKLNSSLAQPVGLPDVLKLFPEEGKEYLSEGYIAQNFLGYSFFNSAYTARYKSEAEFQLFIIQAPADDIQQMLNEYSKSLKENKPVKKTNLLVIKDPFNGTVFMEQKANFLVGVINTENEVIAKEYISRVIKKIP